MNTPVSFNISKLLREKGCDIECNYGYDFRSDTLQNFGRYIVSHMVYNAPTIAEVVMWLHEKYGIWISPQPFIRRDESVVWLYDIFLNNYVKDQLPPSLGVNNLTECYEAAIEYTLNNLI